MKPVYRVWLVGVILALLLSGCGVVDFLRQLDAAGQASDDVLPSAPSLPAGTPLPPLSDLAAGLEQLTSYRVTFELQVGSGSGGDTVSILQEINRETGETHYRMASSGPSGEAVFEYFIQGSDFYLLTQQGSQPPICNLMTSGGERTRQQGQALTPDQLFGPIQPDRLVAPGELLNGLITDRYTVDLGRMELGAGSGQSAEVWIAREGGFVVRFSGEAEGVISGLPAAGSPEGSSRWAYELQSVNSLGAIHLPGECQTARDIAASIPIHPDARERTSVSGVTTYLSDLDPAGLAEFYLAELERGGWSVSETLRLDSLVILQASRSGLSLEISIARQTEDTGSQVMIQER